MKKIILALCLIGSVSTYACSCDRPNFDDQDVNNTLTDFMTSRMDISHSDILSIKEISSKSFLPFGQKALLNLLTLGSGDVRSCTLGCSAGMNAKFQHMIEYRDGNSVCTLKLYSKFTSSFVASGYKSIVKKNHQPACQAL